MKASTKANLYLLFIAAIWGATFPLIRNAIAHIDPILFVFLRFGIAALLMLPLVWRSLREVSLFLLFECLLYGVITAFAYITQTIGLETINSAQSAFITTIYVILVPFLGVLFKLGKLSVVDVICSLICLTGIYILTGADFELNTGEWWTLIGAILFAIQIVYLQRISLQTKNYQLLTFYQLLFTTPAAFVFSYGSSYQSLTNINVIIGLIFCAIIATIVVFSIQTKYQKYTTPAKAALIFALEPVFASIFGFIINGEKLTSAIIYGGLLILTSITLPAIISFIKKLH